MKRYLSLAFAAGAMFVAAAAAPTAASACNDTYNACVRLCLAEGKPGNQCAQSCSYICTMNNRAPAPSLDLTSLATPPQTGAMSLAATRGAGAIAQ